MVFLIPILQRILFPILAGSTFLDIITGQIEFAGGGHSFWHLILERLAAMM